MFKRAYILLLIVMLINIMSPVIGQVRKNAFTINDDQMVLYINLKLSRDQIDSLLRIADIHHTSADKLLRGEYTELGQAGWVVKRLKKDELMLLKPLEELGKNPQIQSILITQNTFGSVTDKQPGYPADVAYGVNNFSKQTVHQLPSGLTRFVLTGNAKAKKVLLSGDFNNWNTLKGTMVKTDTGWIADVKLRTGKHYYKFIVDGHWAPDMNNRLLENDGQGNYNSAYFKYNYTFKLNGYPKAARVTLTGSFNNWDGNELLLTYKDGIWTKQMYIGEGMQTYRFLVDSKPVLDPTNTRRGTDAKGNPVSIINLGTQAVFKLKGYPNAKDVCLAGEFNNWKPNDIHLKRSADGWILNCILPAGNYGYKFIVDGNWIQDPANTHQSLGGDIVNSFIAIKPNYTFTLRGYPNASSVHVIGTFSTWNDFGYTMKHEGLYWKVSVYLKPGKHLYKFMVDGNWIIDPANKLWEQNEFNTGNSVLWIEP